MDDTIYIMESQFAKFTKLYAPFPTLKIFIPVFTASFGKINLLYWGVMLMGSTIGEKVIREKKAEPEVKMANDYLVMAISWYRRRADISQEELAKRLKWSQSRVSKKLSEKNAATDGFLPTHKVITFAEAYHICKAMGSSVSEVLAEYDQHNSQNNAKYSLESADEYLENKNMEDISVTGKLFLDTVFDSNDSLVNDINDPMFQGWFGTYHCYFYSTLSTEDICFHGYLNIPQESGNGCCNVTFKFIYDDRVGSEKEYYGQIILSKKTKGAYCALVNHDDQGEITYLVMSNPCIKNKTICCVLAFALTISGGKDTNHPCIERMIISREKLEGENFELAKAHLLLNDKYIRITEDSFERLLKSGNIPEQFKNRFLKYKTPFDALEEYACRVAIIPESWVKSLPGYSEQEMQKIIDIMRLFSLAPKNNKIKQKTAENDIYNMFRELYEKSDLLLPRP